MRIVDHTGIEGEFVEIWLSRKKHEMTEIKVKRKVVASARKFIGFGLAVFADEKRSTDTVALKVGGRVLSAVVALIGICLVLCEDPYQEEG